MTLKESARREMEKELQERLDTYIRLASESRRAIEQQELQIANYEAKIVILRESLRNLKSQQMETEVL